MMSNEMGSAVYSVFSVQSIIDLIAVIVGLVAIYALLRLNNRLGGKLSVAISFFNLGMISNVLAMVWSTFFGHTYMVLGAEIDIHHLLMSVGMIFFILSTRKLSGLVGS